jgi:hypothetical protein
MAQVPPRLSKFKIAFKVKRPQGNRRPGLFEYLVFAAQAEEKFD